MFGVKKGWKNWYALAVVFLTLGLSVPAGAISTDHSHGVNDTGIDGIGVSVVLSAFKARLTQTGKLYNYGTAMGVGILFMAVMWILVSS